MKEVYKTPQMELIESGAEDIITLSGADEGTGDYESWGKLW